MCNCGCNTCETKGPLLTEGKVKSLLSEGLQYHIDKKIPLFETVYRIGSDKHMSLIKEARKMYSRNIIDLCEEDEALIGTNLGEFALYEGESVPLDLPMLNESNSNYPDFDLDKNIRYQDTVITNGMWRYTGKESGGAGVYRNLNNDQFLSFDRNDLDIFRNNLSSHFDFSESINEDIYDKFLDNPSSPKGRAKSLILKFTKEYGDDASSMAVDRFAKQNNLKPEEKYILKYITKNDIKISSQPGGPDFSALNENKAIITFKNDYEVKMNHIAGYDDDFEYFEAGEREQVYILDKNASFQRVHVEFGDGTNAFIPKDVISIQEESLVKNRINEAVKKALTEKKSKKKEKKDPPLNKPKRGGSKAYYVYVRDPKTKKIKKVSFGSGGLRAKIKNKEARNAFAARHKCSTKKDRTKAGYWSCNLPRYAEALGLGAKMNTFW